MLITTRQMPMPAYSRPVVRAGGRAIGRVAVHRAPGGGGTFLMATMTARALMLACGLALVGCSDPMAKYTKNGQTKEAGFVQAAGKGDLDAVNAFIEAGVNVNAVNDKKATALMDASAGGHAAVVDALMAHGADVQYSNESGWT